MKFSFFVPINWNRIAIHKLLIFYLVVVHPRVSLHPGPSYVTKGSNVTLPNCHVMGHPAPVVTWRKSSGQLPQERAHYNNSVLQISDVGKSDSDWYFCSAVNILGNAGKKTLLVVVSLPVFNVKPPGKVSVFTGDTLTLNCSATGDPQPVISWKRQEASLPVGRSDRTEKALTIRDLREEDAGIYICVATSAGVFPIEAISSIDVELVGIGKLRKQFLDLPQRDIIYKVNLLAQSIVVTSNLHRPFATCYQQDITVLITMEKETAIIPESATE